MNIPEFPDAVGPAPDPGTGEAPAPRSRRRSRRRSVIVAAGVMTVLIGVGALTVPGDEEAGAPASSSQSTVAGSKVPPDAASPSMPASTPLPTWPQEEFRAVLAVRSSAAVSGDRTTFLSTVSSRAAQELKRQQALAKNLDAIGFTHWRYTLGEPLGERDEQAQLLRARVGDDAVVVSADLAYAIRGFDAAPITTQRFVAFVKQGSRWKVAAETDAGKFRLPWDDTPLTVTRGERSLILSAGSSVSSRQLATLADAAIDEVSEVWGEDWSRRVVIVVPRNQSALGRYLRKDGDQYGALAAVATAEESIDGNGAAAERVWVNSGRWGAVTTVGRSIVLRHEITHVATGAARPGPMPVWLEEGLADYIGYRGSGVPTRTIARDLLRDVRADGPPSALPTRSDFAPTSDTLSTAYERAWWACQYIADEYGQTALLKVYRAALADGTAQASDVSLSSVLGLSEAEFVEAWQQSLRRAA